MKPVDPRLLRRAAPARRHLAFVVASGVVTAALVLVAAAALAHVITHAADGVSALRTSILVLLVAVLARGLLAYVGEVSALRAAAAVRSSLRRDLASHVLHLGPAWTTGERSGSVATLMTQGLDALDGYFARFLPQVVLACVVPLAVVVRVSAADPVSALTLAVTLPLIPVFMVLVGMHTRARTARQWSQLSLLGGHFLDVVEGLPTLKVFGRSKAQVELIRSVSEDYRRTTMSTLRLAFVSALVLELLATVATALVAVEVGLRLLHGDMPYETAMLVLLLAPEAYLPLRAVGSSFHASADGVAALTEALDVLETPVPAAAGTAPCDLGRDVIRWGGVTVRYSGRDEDAVRELVLELKPGERLALTGPSGAGKSTLLAVLLGFVSPSSGEVTVGGRPLRELDLDALRSQIAWVPQSPRVFSGTVADNLRLGDPRASDERLAAAASAAGIAGFVEALPQGFDTVLGDRGLTLSTGQRQRLALARAFVRDASLVLLDEPAAHLDAGTAEEIRYAVARLAEGRTLVVVTHDDRWHDLVDRVVRVVDGVAEPEVAARADAVVA